MSRWRSASIRDLPWKVCEPILDLDRPRSWWRLDCLVPPWIRRCTTDASSALLHKIILLEFDLFRIEKVGRSRTSLSDYGYGQRRLRWSCPLVSSDLPF